MNPVSCKRSLIRDKVKLGEKTMRTRLHIETLIKRRYTDHIVIAANQPILYILYGSGVASPTIWSCYANIS